MVSVPFVFVLGVALDCECVECFWRESDRSFTGFVAEVWFEALPREFAVRWSGIVGYAVKVRKREDGPARFVVSVPCEVPEGAVRLGAVSRGSRLRLLR